LLTWNQNQRCYSGRVIHVEMERWIEQH
jgi:hypothetical protein